MSDYVNVDSAKKEQLKLKNGISYLSVEECSAMLGVSKSTVYHMLRANRIDGAFRINRAWRIPVLEPKYRNDRLKEQ